MKILKSQIWLGNNPLSKFHKKLDELKHAEGKRRFLILAKFRVSLYTIYTTITWIGYIQKRLDDDFFNGLEWNKVLERASKEKVSADKLPPFNAHLLNVDIHTLIIFLNILLDDIVKFLNYLLSGRKKPRIKGFYQFKHDLDYFQGEKFNRLKEIISETDWYKELKDLRDDPIVHKGISSSGIIYKENTICVQLLHLQDGKINERIFTNEDVNFYLDSVYNFLVELNDYLCEQFDSLPIEIKKKNYH